MLKTPPMQTATATIENYCSRLQSATLLEDRRAAIEGLRSVAKQYPASVASGSLRELIITLRRDGLGETSKDGDSRGAVEGGDVDTIRLVLETLIRLFEPDPDSPEAGEEINLFMADEFCMRQGNISLLLNLLDPTTPYSDNLSCKLSVQLLSAICAARPERLQESILGAPLGISRLVGVLDNARDDVRYAGLELLTSLTSGAYEELRKIVAFEDVFSKVFALIRMEGGLSESGIVAQDCLTLLVNIVRGSPSNQAMFRESGCISQLAALLKEISPPAEPEPAYLTDNRVRAGWGLLQLVRQLLVAGESSTPQNQSALFRAGTAQTLINLAFETKLPAIVRVTTFRAIADLIQNNAPIQVNFAPMQVHVNTIKEDDSTDRSLQVNGNKSGATSARNSARPSMDKQSTYIIEALLDLVLHQQKAQQELRMAACAVIQAYLVNHNEIRAHFMQRAIAGHKERETAPNVLTALLRHRDDDVTSVVLAAWTVQDLVAQNREAKSAFAAISEGEASEGEDVISAIQTLGGELQRAIQQNAEARLIVALCSTLCILLWDFVDGINSLLAEGSSLLQALIDATKSESDVVAGTASTLLGIIYEFSTKDSPIPRKSLATLLTQKLGRDKYLTALSNFRSDPAIRDFDLPQEESERLELSETFFNLFLEEYPRLRRAIDKDPGIEILPYAAAEAGVQRDILDELRTQITNLESSLAQSQQEAASSSEQAQKDKLQSEQRSMAAQKEAEQAQVDLQKDLKAATAEVERIRAVIAKMQAGHEDELRKAEQRRQNEMEENNVKHARELASIRQDGERKAQQGKQQAEQGFNLVRQDYERRLAELGNAHRTEQTGHNTVRGQLDTLTEQHRSMETRATTAEKDLQESSQKFDSLDISHRQLQERLAQVENELASIRKASEKSEAEATTLKSQINELQEELKGKEQELTTERSGYAELEKELEAVKTAHESTKHELQGVKSAADGTMKELTTAKKDVEAAKKDVEAAKKELESSKSASASASKTSKKDADAAKKADKLKQLSDTLAAEIKQLKSDAEESKKKQDDLETEIKTARDNLKEAKDDEKSAKDELDSLLLVLSEIEGKRDEYKAKLKGLGGEVTDDEEEEDEEEDNDDVD